MESQENVGPQPGAQLQALAERRVPTAGLDVNEDRNPATEPADLVRQVVLRAVDRTGSDRGVLSWVEGDEMVVAWSHDPDGELVPVGSRWPLAGDEVVAMTLASDRPGVGSYDRVDVTGLSPELAATYRGLRQMLVAPVRSAGHDVALLCVSRRRSDPYTAREVEALDAEVRGAAADLRVLRLEERLRTTLDQLHAVAAHTESAERVKTDVLRLASHELRTPLTVLNGYLSLVHTGFFGEIPEPLAGVMEILQRRTAEMNSLVNDMLVAARIDDQPSVGADELADLRELIDIAVRDVMPRASPEHHLRLELPDRPVLVRVDSERVVLALRNIVDNAVKYSPAGGDIRCEATVRDGMARIRVVDNGLGIDPADRDKLFTRFGRVLTTANSHIPGIGLGLYFSREVARRHGGDVALADSEGPGCVFEISLPLVGAAGVAE